MAQVETRTAAHPNDRRQGGRARGQAGINSIHRGLTIIEIMAQQRRPTGVSELARSMALDPATVHRVLATLVAAGWVRRDDETRRYTLSPKLAYLGAAVGLHDVLRQEALASLKRLARQSRETAHLAVLDGGEVLFLAHETGNHMLVVNVDLLSRGPAYCTAVGKAILGSMTRLQVDMRLAGVALEPLTPHTITSLPALYEDLEQVRSRGYAIDDEEYALGVRCVAAPILHQGRPIASIGLTGPTDRLSTERTTRLAADVAAAARDITRLLEGTPAEEDNP